MSKKLKHYHTEKQRMQLQLGFPEHIPAHPTHGPFKMLELSAECLRKQLRDKKNKK